MIRIVIADDHKLRLRGRNRGDDDGNGDERRLPMIAPCGLRQNG